jgi:predicted lysophospholipase L1 biosynthesis ABC-type transport system permease subunit
MMDLVGEFIAAIAEVIAWSLLQCVMAFGWLLWMVLVAGARLVVGCVRIVQRLLARRAAQGELAQIGLEYHAAVADIRRIGADTRRQIRLVKEGRRP